MAPSTYSSPSSPRTPSLPSCSPPPAPPPHALAQQPPSGFALPPAAIPVANVGQPMFPPPPPFQATPAKQPPPAPVQQNSGQSHSRKLSEITSSLALFSPPPPSNSSSSNNSLSSSASTTASSATPLEATFDPSASSLAYTLASSATAPPSTSSSFFESIKRRIHRSRRRSRPSWGGAQTPSAALSIPPTPTASSSASTASLTSTSAIIHSSLVSEAETRELEARYSRYLQNESGVIALHEHLERYERCWRELYALQVSLAADMLFFTSNVPSSSPPASLCAASSVAQSNLSVLAAHRKQIESIHSTFTSAQQEARPSLDRVHHVVSALKEMRDEYAVTKKKMEEHNRSRVEFEAYLKKVTELRAKQKANAHVAPSSSSSNASSLLAERLAKKEAKLAQKAHDFARTHRRFLHAMAPFQGGIPSFMNVPFCELLESVSMMLDKHAKRQAEMALGLSALDDSVHTIASAAQSPFAAVELMSRDVSLTLDFAAEEEEDEEDDEHLGALPEEADGIQSISSPILLSSTATSALASSASSTLSSSASPSFIAGKSSTPGTVRVFYRNPKYDPTLTFAELHAAFDPKRAFSMKSPHAFAPPPFVATGHVRDFILAKSRDACHTHSHLFSHATAHPHVRQMSKTFTFHQQQEQGKRGENEKAPSAAATNHSAISNAWMQPATSPSSSSSSVALSASTSHNNNVAATTSKQRSPSGLSSTISPLPAGSPSPSSSRSASRPHHREWSKTVISITESVGAAGAAPPLPSSSPNSLYQPKKRRSSASERGPRRRSSANLSIDTRLSSSNNSNTIHVPAERERAASAAILQSSASAHSLARLESSDQLDSSPSTSFSPSSSSPITASSLKDSALLTAGVTFRQTRRPSEHKMTPPSAAPAPPARSPPPLPANSHRIDKDEKKESVVAETTAVAKSSKTSSSLSARLAMFESHTASPIPTSSSSTANKIAAVRAYQKLTPATPNHTL